MHLDMKIIQVHACTTLQTFVAAILFQNCPVGTCLIPRFMGVYDAKDGKSKHARFSCKRCNAHARIKWKWVKFKHAMIEIKYEITTDLPVGKGSKFRVFWTRHFVRSTLISLTKISKVWHHFAKVIKKIRTLMWCPGCSGLSSGTLLIGLNFSWYISSRGTTPEMLEITYLDCIVMWSLSRLMQCSLLLVIRQRQ